MAAINRLLSCYQTGNAPADPAALLRRYIEAVEEYEDRDIEAGVDLLIKGKVPGINGSFAPTPPQVATASRMALEKRVDAEALERRLHPRLPPPDVEKTPEARERVRKMVASLTGKLGDNLRTEEAARAAQRRARLFRGDAA